MKIINPTLKDTFTDVTVMLTSGCTMSCAYCFEHQRDHSKDSMMTPETLISILEKHLALGKRFDFHLFGGEPTLNKSCLNALIDYLSTHKELPTHFFMDIQTNAYKLDSELIDMFKELSLLVPCGFAIIVSLDSVVPEGNVHRIDHDKNPTWYDVYNNLLNLSQKVPGAHIETHSVITNESAPYFAETVFRLKKLMDEGLIDNFGMNWIDPDTEGYSLTDEAVDTVMYQYWTLVQPRMVKEKWDEETVSSFMVMGLDATIPMIDNPDDHNYNVCGAGSTLIAYMPDGAMVPCHKFIDKRADDLEIDLNDLPPRKEDIVGENGHFCIDCPMKHSCQTCIASNLMYGGHLFKQSIAVCRRKRAIYNKMLTWKLKKQKSVIESLLNDNNVLSDDINALTIEIGKLMVE